jgi:hypothetical protein
MISRQPDPQEVALGIFEANSRLLAAAERVTSAGVGPVVGGIAVFLHGYRRTTEDVDVYCEDTAAAAAVLESIGAVWDAEQREHRLDGIRIHLVTPAQTGAPPRESVEIQGIRVISLGDLLRFKLRSGLSSPGRLRDLSDVLELIRAARLDKTFAARLPKELRPEFRKLVDAARAEGA